MLQRRIDGVLVAQGNRSKSVKRIKCFERVRLAPIFRTERARAGRPAGKTAEGVLVPRRTRARVLCAQSVLDRKVPITALDYRSKVMPRTIVSTIDIDAAQTQTRCRSQSLMATVLPAAL